MTSKYGTPHCCQHGVICGSLPHSGVGTQLNEFTIPYQWEHTWEYHWSTLDIFLQEYDK